MSIVIRAKSKTRMDEHDVRINLWAIQSGSSTNHQIKHQMETKYKRDVPERVASDTYRAAARSLHRLLLFARLYSIDAFRVEIRDQRVFESQLSIDKVKLVSAASVRRALRSAPNR